MVDNRFLMQKDAFLKRQRRSILIKIGLRFGRKREGKNRTVKGGGGGISTLTPLKVNGENDSAV